MNGLIGIIIASALTIQCINTGEDRLGVILTCDDANRSVLHIPINEWPGVWHGPELGFAYQLDAQGRPMPTNRVAWQQRQQVIRENQLREGRRWRRPAMQQVIK